MAERLGLPFDAHGAAFARFKDEFVSESLRHTRFSADDLVRDPNVPGGITALYDALQRLATDQPGAEDGLDPLLLALSGAYAALRPALAYMRAYEEKAANAAAEATARAQAMAALQAGVAARDAEAAALRADAATRDAEIARLREDVVRRESEMVVIGAGRSELAAALERCEGELRALRGRWEEMLATTWRIPRPAHVLRALRGRRENG
jgi:septal ring factor EnvC (AmiA/AmiB activator)